MDQYYVENNQWGAGYVPHTQTVETVPNFAWEFDYPDDPVEANGVLAYPAIVHGWKPWAEMGTDSVLPCVIPESYNLNVNYNMKTEVKPGCRYNTAFDLWITSKKGGREADITHEVMFWVASKGDNRPAGRQLGTILGCHYYHATQNNSFWNMPWECISIILPLSFGANEYPHSVNLGQYLAELVNMSLLPAENFVASIEFGNEIWGGKGRTTVFEYKVTL